MTRVTLGTLPRTPDVGLERNALMGFLQFGHRMEPSLVARALEPSFRHPALDAVRAAVRAAPDMQRPGWAMDAVSNVREPYRALAAELLAGDFPALDDDEAVTSTADLARRLIVRALEQEKHELLGAIQRVPADSEEGRGIRLRLREIDVERQSLLADV